MGTYAPVTEDELARARTDPAFRQKLLSQNMEALLAGIKKLRKGPAANGAFPQPLNNLAFPRRPRV
jgi:hypothetical protein